MEEPDPLGRCGGDWHSVYSQEDYADKDWVNAAEQGASCDRVFSSVGEMGNRLRGRTLRTRARSGRGFRRRD